MIKVVLASPNKELYNGEAKKVMITTNDGEIGILRGHEPLMTTIKSGQVTIERDDKTVSVGDSVDSNKTTTREVFSAYNGVVNIENIKGKTRVVILVENTENVKDLDEAALRAALESAQKANAEKQDENFNLDTGILRDMNKLRLAKKYKM
jgi:F-type H+-transporting ATPase subunit epsilon